MRIAVSLQAWLDSQAPAWDHPTMSISTVDAKKRIVLPSGKPGEIYDVQRQDRQHVLLVRLECPGRRKPLSRLASLAAMRDAPLQPTMKWEELRKLTRET